MVNVVVVEDDDVSRPRSCCGYGGGGGGLGDDGVRRRRVDIQTMVTVVVGRRRQSSPFVGGAPLLSGESWNAESGQTLDSPPVDTPVPTSRTYTSRRKRYTASLALAARFSTAASSPMRSACIDGLSQVPTLYRRMT